MLKFNGAGF